MAALEAPAEARGARTDGIGCSSAPDHRCFSTIRVSAWPRFLATTISGTPFIAAKLAQVWRRCMEGDWRRNPGMGAGRAHRPRLV